MSTSPLLIYTSEFLLQLPQLLGIPWGCFGSGVDRAPGSNFIDASNKNISAAVEAHGCDNHMVVFAWLQKQPQSFLQHFKPRHYSLPRMMTVPVAMVYYLNWWMDDTWLMQDMPFQCPKLTLALKFDMSQWRWNTYLLGVSIGNWWSKTLLRLDQLPECPKNF